MTSRERWRAILERKPVDRAPCDIWATNEVFEMLCKHFDCGSRWDVIDKLNIDAPYTANPIYTGPMLSKDCDIWGVKCRDVDYGTGVYHEVAFAPLADIENIEDLKNHSWPLADWFDYSHIHQEIDAHSCRPIRAGYIEPFLIYARMRGLERAMIDLIDNIELVEYAFDFIFDFAISQFERILDVADGQIDIAFTAEDLGSQTGPLFSSQIFRRLHKNRFQKYIDLAHQAGAYAFFHTDGACRDFIPELIEIGVDILNPIQWVCPGMERTGLKTDFSQSLVFHGGVENQNILPFGTPEDVREEVIQCFETLGANGGYICAPCHNIQPNTPVENILEMYKTIREIASNAKYID